MVRQRSAKPSFTSSNLVRTSKKCVECFTRRILFYRAKPNRELLPSIIWKIWHAKTGRQSSVTKYMTPNTKTAKIKNGRNPALKLNQI